MLLVLLLLACPFSAGRRSKNKNRGMVLSFTTLIVMVVKYVDAGKVIVPVAAHAIIVRSACKTGSSVDSHATLLPHILVSADDCY